MDILPTTILDILNNEEKFKNRFFYNNGLIRQLITEIDILWKLEKPYDEKGKEKAQLEKDNYHYGIILYLIEFIKPIYEERKYEEEKICFNNTIYQNAKIIQTCWKKYITLIKNKNKNVTIIQTYVRKYITLVKHKKTKKNVIIIQTLWRKYINEKKYKKIKKKKDKKRRRILEIEKKKLNKANKVSKLTIMKKAFNVLKLNYISKKEEKFRCKENKKENTDVKTKKKKQSKQSKKSKQSKQSKSKHKDDKNLFEKIIQKAEEYNIEKQKQLDVKNNAKEMLELKNNTIKYYDIFHNKLNKLFENTDMFLIYFPEWHNKMIKFDKKIAKFNHHFLEIDAFNKKENLLEIKKDFKKQHTILNSEIEKFINDSNKCKDLIDSENILEKTASLHTRLCKLYENNNILKFFPKWDKQIDDFIENILKFNTIFFEIDDPFKKENLLKIKNAFNKNYDDLNSVITKFINDYNIFKDLIVKLNSLQILISSIHSEYKELFKNNNMIEQMYENTKKILIKPFTYESLNQIIKYNNVLKYTKEFENELFVKQKIYGLIFIKESFIYLMKNIYDIRNNIFNKFKELTSSKDTKIDGYKDIKDIEINFFISDKSGDLYKLTRNEIIELAIKKYKIFNESIRKKIITIQNFYKKYCKKNKLY